MNSRVASHPNPRLRQYVPTVILSVLCVYFAFYMLFGPRGIFALGRVGDTLDQKRAEYYALRDQRQNLESDVKLMRPDSLDPDMADEQARKTLGYMKPDEIVIDLQ